MSASLPDADPPGALPLPPPPDGRPAAAEPRKPEAAPTDVTERTRSRKLARLQQALRQADSSAILVAPRVLDRVIRRAWELPGWLWTVPHGDCYVVERQELFRHVEPDELDLGPDQLLPAILLLLARPSPELLDRSTGPALLLAYWRLLFHANVHLALHRRIAEGRLTPEEVRGRIERIGRAAFTEVRTVLVQDRCLPEGPDDRAVYCELAAVYLELRHFAPELLPGHFPGLDDLAAIDRLLAEDVDGEALFAQTRLAGAADPVVPADGSLDESNDYYWKLTRSAERAAAAGNSASAAILRTKAARVAPAALAPRTRALADADLRRLLARLRAALQLSEVEAAEWFQDLSTLLDKADQGRRPVEAAVLYDLQTVCLDNERDIYTLDVVEWFLSGGHRPIKRSLPGQRLVRIVRHLRSAGQRLTRARLSDADRHHLGKLLAGARERSEERLRAAMRPVLTDALGDVGLGPTNPPERAAFDKMVEELLDRIAVYGFLTFTDLRDALSRNQLKLPDLTGPQQFIRGDQLIRLDRRLATVLDGVYHRGECYLRWLERLTSLNFGTEAGRRVTGYFTVPFGAALLLSELPRLVLGHLAGVEVPRLTVQLPLFLVLALLLLGLMHVPALRRVLAQAARGLGRVLRAVLVDVPARLLRVPALRRLAMSWPVQLLYWYVLKPLAVCAVLWLWVPAAFGTLLGAGAIFLAANFVVNSRLGTAVSEAMVRTAVGFYDALRGGLLPGLVRLVIRVFKELLDAGEYVLFSVDEWLRFRAGDRWPALALRAVLGVVWYPVSYALRFAMVVLVEPFINPIKFPICSIAAKFIYPLAGALAPHVLEHLEPVVGLAAGRALFGVCVFFLPNSVGFLFWETKENWRLYRANRRPALSPVGVGPHGETVRQLLRPGFHSGTVPRLFARLRQAEREACVSGKWRTAAAHRHHLEEVEEAVRAFVQREMVSLLRQARSWGGFALAVGRVVLTPNRIAVELTHAGADRPVWLEFEERARWLVAGVRGPGWLDELTAEQREVFTTALAGLYKLAGVELVREQIAASLPAGAGYDVVDRGLAVWTDPARGPAALYDLRDGRARIEPRTPAGAPAKEWPVLCAGRAVFARAPLAWQRWIACWEQDQAGTGHPHLFTLALEPLPAS